MSNLIKRFTDGFIVGVKETPRMYFAPLMGMMKVVYHQAHDDNSMHSIKKEKKKEKEVV